MMIMVDRIRNRVMMRMSLMKRNTDRKSKCSMTRS